MILSVREISKRYGAVQALDSVSLDLAAGSVTALVGDNGAGKSTLVKVISGVVKPDSGIIDFAGPKASMATVYQDLALCDNLDVVANLYLGAEAHFAGMLKHLAMETTARKLLASLDVRIPNLTAPVATLSGGQRQSVAIARALIGSPKLVILDEPTAALGVEQTAQVLALIGRLRERGLAVLLISHNLADVWEVSDRISVLRLGRNVGTYRTADVTRETIVGAITGASA